jgi:hypothetical protein
MSNKEVFNKIRAGAAKFLLYLLVEFKSNTIDFSKEEKEKYKVFSKIVHEATINSYIRDLIDNDILIVTKEKYIYKLNDDVANFRK